MSDHSHLDDTSTTPEDVTGNQNTEEGQDAGSEATQSEATQSEATQPVQEPPARPRRRRAASRPAGPPAVVEPQPSTVAPASQDEPDGQEESAGQEENEDDEVENVDAPAVDAPAVDTPAVDTPAPEAPAADTADTAEREVSDSAPESDPAPESVPAPESEPAGEPEKSAPRARTRKRATRAQAPAAPTPVTETDDADNAPGGSAAEDAAEAEDASAGIPNPFADAPEPERRGRRRRPARQLADPFAPPVDAGEDHADEKRAGEDHPGGDHADGDRADGDRADGDHADEPGENASGSSEGDDDQTVSDAGGSEDSSDSEDGEGGGNRRRRRRRGGRRRRRGGSDDSGDDDSGDDSSDDDSDDDPGDNDDESDDNADAGDDGGVRGTGAAGDDEDDQSSQTRRRRRRRRRRGEDDGASEDDPSEVVVRVREPRSRRGKSSDEVAGIDGSTRMEAKRQRRREGRQASRRRTPILSESEFLARRESVKRQMVIRQNEELSQIAVIEDGVLVEHYVDRDSAASLIGNVYLGRVQNVLPSMEAAFIDIGRGRNAVLYAGEVDWDSFGTDGQSKQVERVLKSGQTVLVQVTKDPVGAKGARLTNHVSIPGRYVVYSPGGHLSGISRKLPENERKRLKDILSELVDENASVIVRTAAEGASEDELVRDVNRLKAQWEVIEKQVKAGQAPQLLHGEPDLTLRIVRDLFTEDFSELTIDGNGTINDAYDTVEAYVGHVAPHLKERLVRWDREERGTDVFAAHRLDEQIAKALERKVFLPSGGSLIIDRTEAMTVIDVNTGKFTGSGGNLEATVTSNNLEAAEEVVRQLRLRDIGGIIVIDFIDMVLPQNRELLLRRLVECLGRDRTRHQVAEVTSLGLVQMTRKKIGTGLAEAFTEPCDCCKGRGYHIHDMPVESQTHSDGGERGGSGTSNRGGRRRRGGGSRDSSGSGNGGSGNGGSGNGGSGNGGSGNGGHGSGGGQEKAASAESDTQTAP